jgi:hypothetical protein
VVDAPPLVNCDTRGKEFVHDPFPESPPEASLSGACRCASGRRAEPAHFEQRDHRTGTRPLLNWIRRGKKKYCEELERWSPPLWARGGSIQPTTGDYPASWRNAAQDSLVDTWGYYNRECTSWVAWRLRGRNGYEMTRAVGNANRWGDWARGRGYAVDGTPRVGRIAVGVRAHLQQSPLYR